jgi:hypothetical protein
VPHLQIDHDQHPAAGAAQIGAEIDNGGHRTSAG